MPGAISTLLELRRRKVFRGVGYYLIGAWTLLQVGEVIIEPAGLPPWSMTALLYLSILGFPLAIWLAWKFELTDHGLVRTAPAKDTADSPDYSLKASDFLVFGVLVAITAYVGWQGLGNIRSEAIDEETRIQAEMEAEREAVENSIAVLPFRDMSRVGDQAFMGEGIADTVLHVLSQVKGLTVSARTSSFSFQDRNLTIEEIAKSLGVAHVLEGSVQTAGDQVRIITRLINARNGRELWSGNFDRQSSELFAIQDEIAAEVVTALSIELLEDDRERLAKQYQPDLDAYQQYILGWRELEQGTTESIANSVKRFEQAIEIDPDYALAYTALASAMRVNTSMRGVQSFDEMKQQSMALVEKALDLDPTLSEAWSLRAMSLAEDKEFDASRDAILKAIELNPNSAAAWSGYWNYLILVNEPDAALDAIRKAVEIDPESISYRSNLATQLFDLGRAEEAMFMLKENVRRHPGSPNVYFPVSRYLNQFGRPGESMWYLQSIYRRDPQNPFLHDAICLQHWQLWDMEAATQCWEEHLIQNPGNRNTMLWLAWMRDDLDEAVRISKESIEQRPNQWYPKLQLADSLSLLGQWEEIIELVGGAFPDLLGDDPQINNFSSWPARRLAEALVKTGNTAQAELLVSKTLEHIAKSRKLQAGGWMAGPDDALFYALMGDSQSANDSLEAAIDDDWMFYAHALIYDSTLNSMREDERFKSLVARLQQNLAEQRLWYEQHKDDLQL